MEKTLSLAIGLRDTPPIGVKTPMGPLTKIMDPQLVSLTCLCVSVNFLHSFSHFSICKYCMCVCLFADRQTVGEREKKRDGEKDKEGGRERE